MFSDCRRAFKFTQLFIEDIMQPVPNHLISIIMVIHIQSMEKIKS